MKGHAGDAGQPGFIGVPVRSVEIFYVSLFFLFYYNLAFNNKARETTYLKRFRQYFYVKYIYVKTILLRQYVK